MTQVAKESISATGAAAPEAVSTNLNRIPPSSKALPRTHSLHLSRNIGSSSRSSPLAATITKLNITCNASDIGKLSSSADDELNPTEPNSNTRPRSKEDEILEKGNKVVDTHGQGSSSADILNAEDKQSPTEDLKVTSSGWLGWLAWPANNQTRMTEISQKTPVSADVQDDKHGSPEHVCTPPKDTSERRSSDPNPVSGPAEGGRSWLTFLGSAAQPSMHQHGAGTASILEPTPSQSDGEGNTENAVKSPEDPTPSKTEASSGLGKSLGWAFWSKNNIAQQATGDVSQPGDMAKVEGAVSDAPKPGNKSSDESRSLEVSRAVKTSAVPQGAASNAKVPTVSQISAPVNHAVQMPKTKRNAVNLLLPSIDKTYHLVEKPSIIQQVVLPYSQLYKLYPSPHLQSIANSSIIIYQA